MKVKPFLFILVLFFTACQPSHVPDDKSGGIPARVSTATETANFPTDTPLPKKTITPTTIILPGKVNVSSLRIRSEPSIESNLIGGLSYGDDVSIYGKNNSSDWVYLTYRDFIGWTMFAYLDVDGGISSLPILTPGAETITNSSVDISENALTISTATYTRTPGKTNTPYPTLTKTKMIANTPYPTPTKSIMECRQTYNFVGMQVTCMIKRAYCSYQPNVDGSPTFCNDAPYPNHNFALVVWRKDWSSFDGGCLIVKGLVSYYDGRPQIEATTKSQVSYCQ